MHICICCIYIYIRTYNPNDNTLKPKALSRAPAKSQASLLEQSGSSLLEAGSFSYDSSFLVFSLGVCLTKLTVFSDIFVIY